MGSIVWTVGLVAPAVYFRNNIKMGGETEVETPVVDNKIEDTVKTDKEIIAEEEKVYLYQSPRTPQIPSISAQELKLESWLKLQGISYENIDHKSKLTSKTGTLPFIEFNGKEISDIDAIKTLADKFGKDMSGHLDQEQRNVEHAMIKMVENHLYWAIMNWRTSNVDNTIKAYKVHLPTFYGSKIPIGILNMHFKFNVCRKTQKKLKSQGMTNIEETSKNDLNVLSNMLAEKEFMFGDAPSMLDMVVYSHLAQLVMIDAEYLCPLRDFVQEECKNLVDLVNRMKEKCWGDHWELAIGDKLELNPHIPKPEPEVEGKKEEEEVKDGEKKSKEENITAKEESATELKEEASDKQEDATEKKE